MLTIPRNLKQNERDKQFNGTLISLVKFFLNDLQLSKEFWEYDIDSANYIHNRIPHSDINNKIPFEFLFKTKMDYSRFKVFMYKVFFFIPKSQRNKFENNSLLGIYLGYHQLTNSYKILNIANKMFVLSRSV